MAEKRTRIIYYGDNLEILREYVPDESADLVYLDPPFKSQRAYNILFRNVKGEPAEAQVRAFTDTWKWDRAARATYERLMEDPKVPGKVSKMIESFYNFLKGPRGEGSEMLAYLVMMTPRLLQLHRVLKPTGSLYLHCDPAASHYLKIVLDAVFGPKNFRNEIVWHYGGRGAKAIANQFPRNHDVILSYCKAVGSHVFHRQYGERLFTVDEARSQGFRQDEQGRWFKTAPRGDYTDESVRRLEAEGRIHRTKTGGIRIKYFMETEAGFIKENTLTGDTWFDIPDAMHIGKERLGYETQKPLALLRRIIQASTNPGDLVLDPFCGCGTALVAAEELNRSWIGIDITYLAVDVMKRRLRDHFPGISFEIRGQPQDEEGARALAEKDRFQFQVWALSLIDAQPLDPDRKGADRGIDGYLTVPVGRDQYERGIVQVKSGHVGPSMVRDLKGTMEREKAPFALLITLEPSTEAMRREAVDAGFYQAPAIGGRVPRMQILTVRELLQGKRPQMPTGPVSPMPTAPRIKRAGGKQLPLKEKQ